MTITLEKSDLERVLFALSQFQHNADFKATHDEIVKQMRRNPNKAH